MGPLKGHFNSLLGERGLASYWWGRYVYRTGPVCYDLGAFSTFDHFESRIRFGVPHLGGVLMNVCRLKAELQTLFYPASIAI
jgi:hypothetical protein